MILGLAIGMTVAAAGAPKAEPKVWGLAWARSVPDAIFVVKESTEKFRVTRVIGKSLRRTLKLTLKKLGSDPEALFDHIHVAAQKWEAFLPCGPRMRLAQIKKGGVVWEENFCVEMLPRDDQEALATFLERLDFRG